MYLIVGLGNPGSKYLLSRHNVGFMVVDAVVEYFSGGTFRRECRAETCKIQWHSQPILLAKPQTFMNFSGECIRALVHYYKIDLEKLLVIHDEVDLSFGIMKYQKQRGHGGHNGVCNIHQHLGTNNYSRLRMGVDRPSPQEMGVSDFVLSDFSKGEQGKLACFLSEARDSVLHFIERGFAATANHYNQKKTAPRSESPNHGKDRESKVRPNKPNKKLPDKKAVQRSVFSKYVLHQIVSNKGGCD